MSKSKLDNLVDYLSGDHSAAARIFPTKPKRGTIGQRFTTSRGQQYELAMHNCFGIPYFVKVNKQGKALKTRFTVPELEAQLDES